MGFLDETGISCRVRVEPCFSVAMGYRLSHVTQEHLSEIQKIKSNFVWFCSILLTVRRVVFANAKEIFCFEARV